MRGQTLFFVLSPQKEIACTIPGAGIHTYRRGISKIRIGDGLLVKQKRPARFFRPLASAFLAFHSSPVYHRHQLPFTLFLVWGRNHAGHHAARFHHPDRRGGGRHGGAFGGELCGRAGGERTHRRRRHRARRHGVEPHPHARHPKGRPHRARLRRRSGPPRRRRPERGRGGTRAGHDHRHAPPARESRCRRGLHRHPRTTGMPRPRCSRSMRASMCTWRSPARTTSAKGG